MPIYEFYCSACHRVFSFLSSRIDTRAQPSCPRCGRADLERRVSVFAIVKGATAPEHGQGADEMAGLDEGRLMQAMEQLGPQLESLNESNPRDAARMMRKLFDMMGSGVKPGMEEALRRMEAGEDMEKIEQELGEVFDQDPFGGPSDASEPTGAQAWQTVRSRILPPTVDPELYDLD